MNPEWMEWATDNMPADLLKQMLSSRNWDLEWRNTQIASLTAERDKLREALREAKRIAMRIKECSLEPDKVYLYADRIRVLQEAE